MEEDCLIIELTGTQNKLEAFLNLLKDYEILELARTGITGLSRGSKDVAFSDPVRIGEPQGELVEQIKLVKGKTFHYIGYPRRGREHSTLYFKFN